MTKRVHEDISIRDGDAEILRQAAQECGLDLPHYLSEIAEVKAAEIRLEGLRAITDELAYAATA